MSDQRFWVGEELAGKRLDLFLSESVPTLSRRTARALCERGAVLVDEHVARAGRLVKTGELVTVTESLEPVRPRPDLVEAGDALQPLFEDDALFVFAKRRGEPSVRLRLDDGLTAADRAVAYLPRCEFASADPRDGGLVQRLDTWTSGLLLVAKDAETWASLRALLFEGAIEKSYLALCEGVPTWNEREIDEPLAQTADGKAMFVSDERDMKAMTAHSSMRLVGGVIGAPFACSLIRVEAHRARRHQVRVHLAELGHPLVGDSVYGAWHRLEELQGIGGAEFVGDGFVLHAESLTFPHPRDGSCVVVELESTLLQRLPVGSNE